jgi:hypothetical protein
MIAAELCARVRDTRQLSMHVCGCEVYMDELLDLGPVAAGSGVAADFKFKRFSTATLKRVPVRGADEVRAAVVRKAYLSERHVVKRKTHRSQTCSEIDMFARETIF